MANKNLFNSIKLKRPNRNVFDLTHDVKMSLSFDNLYPILAQECVPGDKFTIGCESLLRFAPLIAPVMHRMNVTMHYFFVPNRLVWEGWEKFITGDQDIVPPYMNIGSSANEYPLFDYMGIPSLQPGVERQISALPFAAYQMIYNEYYRDQNLIAQVDYKLVNGNNSGSAELSTLRKRAWQHDYFTAALPWAQKGPAVEIPVGQLGDIPVKVNQNSSLGMTGWNSPLVNATTIYAQSEEATGSGIGGSELYADTSDAEANATSINDLRRAFRLQEWLEKNARAGTRYVESILAHFGVKSSDSRLNRPEYITGTKSPVVISEVLNTTGENGGLPQGNMAGHGVSVTSGKYGNYFCEEHGYIIGVMSVMADPAYQQGIPKHFLKNDRFDYFWPEFAHIGEQPILNQELYVNGSDPDGTFGYVPRYSEYKYMPSRVAGDFKTSLNYWHLGRIFDTPPALNQQFVEGNASKRIFAVEDLGVDCFYAHVLNKIKAVRPMPKFGTPMF